MSHSIPFVKEKAIIKPLGDAAATVQFGADITPELHRKVQAFTFQLAAYPFAGFIECVPAFVSVTVFYDPVVVYQAFGRSPFQAVSSVLADQLSQLQTKEVPVPRLKEIPVCYGGSYGPDLQYVASYHGLSEHEVISIHTSGEYIVYMIGFAPGFPYLGGLSEKLSTPRRSSPRLAIPAGSVGIGGSQTGVYPLETPGGWQLIGRTCLPLFTPDKQPPSLLQPGDIVKFVPVTEEEYKVSKEG